MVSLNLQNDVLSFRNIVKEDLPEVLDWYNRLDEFMFATGVDRLLTMKEMSNKFYESAVSGYDFFVWIVNKQGRKIGILKGSMKYRDKDSIWINSILIDSDFRGKGYGKKAVETLMEYAREKFGLNKTLISVIEDNTGAICFWNKIGFRQIKKLKNHISLGEKTRDVIILQKK
ncbi:MAG: N-acetyltransferase family protein [Ignavibacteriales bacterium]